MTNSWNDGSAQSTKHKAVKRGKNEEGKILPMVTKARKGIASHVRQSQNNMAGGTVRAAHLARKPLVFWSVLILSDARLELLAELLDAVAHLIVRFRSRCQGLRFLQRITATAKRIRSVHAVPLDHSHGQMLKFGMQEHRAV